MWDIALLMSAAFVAGALNAVAGGGSFLTLPALVFTGVPPVAANATGTVALLPGYMAGAWGFRQDMEPPPGLGMRGVIVLSLIGGSLGAALLLVTPDHLFRKVVPWLLLAATAMFAFAPQLRRMASRGSAEHAAHASPLKAGAGMLAVAIYGGHFQRGPGRPPPRPIGTMRPPSASTSMAVAQVAGMPRASKATSTPLPSVSLRTSSRAFCLTELTTAVAPNFLTASSLSSSTSIAITWRAPKALAIWQMLEPTPPVATTATVSPKRRSAPRRTAP